MMASNTGVSAIQIKEYITEEMDAQKRDGGERESKMMEGVSPDRWLCVCRRIFSRTLATACLFFYCTPILAYLIQERGKIHAL
jgi:hypothetical protein